MFVFSSNQTSSDIGVDNGGGRDGDRVQISEREEPQKQVAGALLEKIGSNANKITV